MDSTEPQDGQTEQVQSDLPSATAPDAAGASSDTEEPMSAEEVPALAEDSDVLESEVAAAPAPRRRDPLASALLVVALMLVIALLATTVGVYFYLMTLNKAPRTAAERDIATSEVATKERPNDVVAWTDLAYAYARAGRTDDALDAADEGEKLKNGETLAIVRADVLRSAGRLEDSIKAYDTAEKQVKELFKRQLEAARKMDVKADLTDDSLARVYWGRGSAKADQGDVKGAIADLEKSVKEDPTQASAWSKLGDLYSQVNQPDEARAAYKSALKYIPDMQEALEGLKRLGTAGD